MKEINESSFSEENSVREMDISYNKIMEYRKVLQNKDSVSIHFNKFNPLYIGIKTYSFLTIIQKMGSYPEDNIVFLRNNIILYTPQSSFRLSKSSINNSLNNNHSSFSSSFKKENLKHIKEEEIINTDITPKNDNNLNENIIIENNNNKEDIEYMNNLKNMQRMNKNKTPDVEKEEIINRNKKFIIFKWIFHFYLIVGILLLLHLISFFLSPYNDYYYKWVCSALIISLIYVGTFGIKNEIPNELNLFLCKRNLFKTNFVIFILTFISFISLISVGGSFQLIKEQGFIGYLIVFIFIITLIIEGIYVIYYDIIINEISLEKQNNIGDFNRYLDIQLVDVN